jgi:hypothetical protein
MVWYTPKDKEHGEDQKTLETQIDIVVAIKLPCTQFSKYYDMKTCHVQEV